MTGSVKVKIDDESLKRRMRDLLAQAWDEGFKERHSGGRPDPDGVHIAYGPNPYRHAD